MDWVAAHTAEIGEWLKRIGLGLSPLLLTPLLALVPVPQLSKYVRGISRTIDRISGGALYAAITMAIIMVLAQLAVVIARYVFGVAFTWLSEVVTYAFAGMFLLGACAALRDDEHVRVDIFRPRFGEKGKALIELLGVYLFIIPITFLVLWASAPIVSLAWRTLETSRESDGLPLLYLFKSLIPLFALLLMAQSVSEGIKAAQTLAGASSSDEEAA